MYGKLFFFYQVCYEHQCERSVDTLLNIVIIQLMNQEIYIFFTVTKSDKNETLLSNACFLCEIFRRSVAYTSWLNQFSYVI